MGEVDLLPDCVEFVFAMDGDFFEGEELVAQRLQLAGDVLALAVAVAAVAGRDEQVERTIRGAAADVVRPHDIKVGVDTAPFKVALDKKKASGKAVKAAMANG